MFHVTKLTAYQHCVDAGLWSDNPGSGVPGAAAAAEQGVSNLAALFGGCVGAHAACHLFCAGASLTLQCLASAAIGHMGIDTHPSSAFASSMCQCTFVVRGQTDRAVVIKQAALDLPPVPGDLQRLYSQSHLALDAERLAAQR